MKKLFLKLFGFVLVFNLFLHSVVHCQTGQINNPFLVDIRKDINNIKTINLSSIGKELSYIPLETAPGCLISEINHLEFSDAYIFVSEPNRLLQFGKNGKFIRQIGSQGRGPAEYLSVRGFSIDNTLQEIYILSFYQNLVFSFDGSFRRSFKLTNRPSQIICPDQNSLMYNYPNIPGQKYFIANSWSISDKNGITKQTFKNHLMRVSQPGMIPARTPFYLFNSTCHFMEFCIDTLYYFQDSQKKPYAIFNFENLKMDPDPLITPATKDIVGEKLYGKFWTNSIYENKDYLFIKFLRGISEATMCAIFNKRTMEFTILTDNTLKNDLDGGINFWPRQIINDTLLVDYLDSFEILKRIKKMQSETHNNNDKRLKTKFTSLSKMLTETSNPVLVVLK